VALAAFFYDQNLALKLPLSTGKDGKNKTKSQCAFHAGN
tara:strand:- start:3527 stop:3643 length:117 start_codon:yes stop_codon:yes gene_type:complete